MLIDAAHCFADVVIAWVNVSLGRDHVRMASQEMKLLPRDRVPKGKGMLIRAVMIAYGDDLSVRRKEQRRKPAGTELAEALSEFWR